MKKNAIERTCKKTVKKVNKVAKKHPVATVAVGTGIMGLAAAPIAWMIGKNVNKGIKKLAAGRTNKEDAPKLPKATETEEVVVEEVVAEQKEVTVEELNEKKTKIEEEITKLEEKIESATGDDKAAAETELKKKKEELKAVEEAIAAKTAKTDKK